MEESVASHTVATEGIANKHKNSTARKYFPIERKERKGFSEK